MSWDVSMTATKPSWRIAVNKGDRLNVATTYDTGSASWFDLARETFRLIGADPGRVHATTTDRFARPASRPAWSVLSTRAWTGAGLSAPRVWQEALADYLS